MINENNYKIQTEKTTIIDEQGNETTTSIEKKINYQKHSEPEFIKLYTDMWCVYNEIPNAYRNLFLQLALRMSYCNSTDLKSSQIVYTGEPISTEICSILNWKRNMYQKGLKVLVECNAIRRINRGVYQINPSYAGKGLWKYDSRLKQGGIEDLITTFRFKDHEVETQVIWADDGSDSEINNIYRDGLDVKEEEEGILKLTKIKKISNTDTDDEDSNNDLSTAVNQ